MNDNLLLCTDVYKMGHMEQYPKGTTKIYSYLCARRVNEVFPDTIFFGLQYYLQEYLAKGVSFEDVAEFLEIRKMILGSEANADVRAKLYDLARLGYLPLQIKAIPEGTIVPPKNVLMTVTNTHPDFYWLVGFMESLLLKVWNTCTVASYSYKFKQICKKYAAATCDNEDHIPFQVHDFGYRGCSSEETAALSGAAHLLNFMGTDTVPAVKLLRRYYAALPPIGLSVPATEHSVMCAFGKENEIGAFENVLDLYPKGIVSIVSDTYNLWEVLTKFTDKLRDRILSREGKVVFRPDSGDPEKIICGDLMSSDPNEMKGALRILDEKFGSVTNSKGFKVLNNKVGLIYGDAMYIERFERILSVMQAMGYASSSLVVGVGGLLLQQRSRDEQGFSIKATYAEIDGKPCNLMKDPITDKEKASHCGLLSLQKDADGTFKTIDKCRTIEEQNGLLENVFYNGAMPYKSFAQIKKTLSESEFALRNSRNSVS